MDILSARRNTTGRTSAGTEDWNMTFKAENNEGSLQRCTTYLAGRGRLEIGLEGGLEIFTLKKDRPKFCQGSSDMCDLIVRYFGYTGAVCCTLLRGSVSAHMFQNFTRFTRKGPNKILFRPRLVNRNFRFVCCGSRNATTYADTDRLFPVFGFGGKLGPDQPANHCFPVNFDENRPEVQGMDGVLQVQTCIILSDWPFSSLSFFSCLFFFFLLNLFSAYFSSQGDQGAHVSNHKICAHISRPTIGGGPFWSHSLS